MCNCVKVALLNVAHQHVVVQYLSVLNGIETAPFAQTLHYSVCSEQTTRHTTRKEPPARGKKQEERFGH